MVSETDITLTILSLDSNIKSSHLPKTHVGILLYLKHFKKKKKKKGLHGFNS